eukprot:CAMPEP_0177796500 /NCGR_PEP_ID=MMETSP0491_2-20121128/26811_1 /TAXON_ID=63592 /ORGANISM="Tetraselmis chuii, Strain PLY429" /LENGTH=985 /DNA_ID=CAMNT_0019319425 /DNA_START=118 /DNA_END=3075 /DNA_ORIENTATION=+
MADSGGDGGGMFSNVTSAMNELLRAPWTGAPSIGVWGVETRVVDFQGVLNGNVVTNLQTLDVCPNDQALKSLFVSSYYLRNVTAFTPLSVDYYFDYLLPRVLPWAASFLAVALVFLLSFLLWRLIICSVRCCCPASGACSSCTPSDVPSKVLTGCWFRTLQCIITFLLLAVIAVSVWGCFTAGPQLVSQTWKVLDVVVVYFHNLQEVGKALLQLGRNLAAESNALLDYLRANFGPAFFERISACVAGQGQQITGVAQGVGDYLAQLAQALAQATAAATVAVASLARITGGFLGSLLDATGAGAEIAQLQAQTLAQTRTSLAAYLNVPSPFTPADLAPVVTANAALDIPAKIDEVDAISVNLLTLSVALESGALASAIGESQALLTAVQAVNTQAARFTPVVQPLQELVTGLATCADEGLEEIRAINRTVIRLPSDISASIQNLDLSQLSSSALTEASETSRQLQAALGGFIDTAFQAAISRLQRLQTSMQTISAAEVNALYDYLNGADGNVGLKGLLEAAEQPVRVNTQAAQAFTASSAPTDATQFSDTQSEAEAALRALEAGLGLGGLQPALNRLSTLRQTLQTADLPGLDAQLQSLQGELQSRLPTLQRVGEEVNATLAQVRSVAAANLEEGLRDAVDFLEQLNATIYLLDNTVKEVQDMYLSPDALASLEDALLEVNATVEAELDRVAQYRTVTVAVDDARVYLTYVLFALAILASIMIIIGVWTVVPFLCSFFMLVLLVCLLFFFILFIPYGAVTTVGSDSCKLVEAKVSEVIRGMDSLSEDERAVMVSLWEYWTLGTTLDSVTEAVSVLVDFDVDGALVLVRQVRGEVEEQLARFGLQSVAQAMVNRISSLVGQALAALEGGIEMVEREFLSPLYAAAKGTVCCTVIGTAGYQWLAMLLAGCFIVAAAFFTFLFIGKIDKLPDKSVRCACCGCYRHRRSDKVDFSQFMTGAQRQEMGNMYGPEEPDIGFPHNDMDMDRRI